MVRDLYVIRPARFGLDFFVNAVDNKQAREEFCRAVGLTCEVTKTGTDPDGREYTTFRTGTDVTFYCYKMCNEYRAELFLREEREIENDR